jgi:outer membrane biosynthesis protein TonB
MLAACGPEVAPATAPQPMVEPTAPEEQPAAPAPEAPIGGMSAEIRATVPPPSGDPLASGTSTPAPAPAPAPAPGVQPASASGSDDWAVVAVEGQQQCYRLRDKAPGGETARAATNGDFDMDAISRTPASAPSNDLQRCYQDVLRRNPNATGRVLVTFMVEADGSVRQACTTHSAIRDEAFNGCVARVFLRKQFPRSENPERVTVTYPVQFTPGT